MSLILAILLPSLIGIMTLPAIPNRRLASYWSSLLSSLTFFIAIPLIIQVYHSASPEFLFGDWLFCDKLSAFFLGINTFIAMNINFYAISYLNNESRIGIYGIVYRFFHTFFHLFNLGMLLVCLSNNIGILWIAIELATISSVVLVALYQTPEALEAAWKYLVLCGVGIALALIGTVIVYFAASLYLPADQGLLWTALMAKAPMLSSKLLMIAFTFIFIGYGTKVGFFPLHNWLPDAYAEGPAPIAALLSGLLLNIAFLAILRFKILLEHANVMSFPQDLFLAFGFASLLYAAFSLLNQRKLNRLFAYSSIEHVGLISIAFGLGTPLAYLAGLLHIMLHALGKSAVFLSCGAIIQRFRTQTLSQLNGLSTVVPFNAWCLLFGTLVLLGMPPFGMFFSELLLILATAKTHLWLLVPLLLGITVSFLAIFSKIQSVIFSETPTATKPLLDTHHLSWPGFLHLLLILFAGLYIRFFYLKPILPLLIGGKGL